MESDGRRTGDSGETFASPCPLSRHAPPLNAPLPVLLAYATTHLQPTSDSPRLDAEVLMCHVLNRNRAWLFTWPEHTPTPKEREDFLALVARRASGEPVAYLTGVREFWSLSLAVSPATLIPRADTELLVEAALERLAATTARVLDLGTGTGAIALALASERPGWTLVAVDRETAAVTLARQNCEMLKLGNVEILHSDWFSAVSGRFDLIVSNPPYIDPKDPHLNQGDVRHEPASALVAADCGLADLARIIATAPDFLEPNGLLLVEHGADQGAAVRQLFGDRGFRETQTLRDLAGLERVTLAKMCGGSKQEQ